MVRVDESEVLTAVVEVAASLRGLEISVDVCVLEFSAVDRFLRTGERSGDNGLAWWSGEDSGEEKPESLKLVGEDGEAGAGADDVGQVSEQERRSWLC